MPYTHAPAASFSASSHPVLVKKRCPEVQAICCPLDRCTLTRVRDGLAEVAMTVPAPTAVSTEDPGFNRSMGISPCGVAIGVPAGKHSSITQMSRGPMSVLRRYAVWMPATVTWSIDRDPNPADSTPSGHIGDPQSRRIASASCATSSLTCTRTSTRPPHCCTAVRQMDEQHGPLPAPVGKHATGAGTPARKAFHRASIAPD